MANICELIIADNIMAVENTNPLSASAFFSLLGELENHLDLPQLKRESNNPSLWGTEIVEPDRYSPLICDGPIPLKLNLGQKNIPEEINFDLQDIAIKLFPEEEEEEEDHIQYCKTCGDYLCECDKMVHCQCGNLYHIAEPYQMCFNCEMAERRQDLIDQELYPDDIPDRY
jgi:hypothetical protein